MSAEETKKKTLQYSRFTFKVLFSTGPKRNLQHPKHIHLAWHALDPLDISSEFRVEIEVLYSKYSMKYSGIPAILVNDIALKHAERQDKQRTDSGEL